MLKERQQIWAARVSIFGSIALFFISAIVGVIVDSITLILDASASLVILAAAFLMQFAIKKIHQPPDDEYHFGYYKYEPLTAAVQGVLIVVTCIVSIKFAVQDIVHAEAVHSYILPVIATFLSGILGLLVTGYLKHAAQKTNSQMIKVTSVHWMADTMLSFGVCAGFVFGLIAQDLGYTYIAPYVDPVMAIVLALFLATVPFKGCRHNLVELLDAAPVTHIRAQIKKIVDVHKARFSGLHRLRVRKAGQEIFINACFLTKADMTVAQAEELSKGFEQDVKNNFPECDVIVHFKAQRS